MNERQKRNRIDILTEIAELKKALADTDYKAIKFAEGMLTEEEFAPIRAERQKMRDRINELENK